METLQSLILGILQGLTEFLPISSSGHLVLGEHFFKITPDLSFNILLHVATLFAVLVFFRKTCFKILLSFKTRDSYFHLFILIIIASIPTAFIGFLGKSYIENFMENSSFTAGALVVNGLLIISSKRFLHKLTTSQFTTPPSFLLSKKTILIALLIGVVQGIAIIPGISRSGSTIIAALYLGFSGGEAFLFSFLLSIPAIVGAFLFEFSHFSLEASNLVLAVGFVSAFICGLFSIYIIRASLIRGFFPFFGYYCLIIGGAALFFL